MAADKKSDGIMSGCSDDLSTNLEEMMTQERRDFSNCNENWLRLQDEMHSEAAAAISDEDELRAAIALSLDNNYGQAALKPWSSSVESECDVTTSCLQQGSEGEIAQVDSSEVGAWIQEWSLCDRCGFSHNVLVY